MIPQSKAPCDTFGPPEQATKICFDFSSKAWVSSPCYVRLAMQAFDKGCQRIAFKLREVDENGTPVSECVAKFMDPTSLSQNGVGPVTRQMYYDDVITQLVAGRYAEGFNSFEPPKPVKFLPAWILEFPSRQGTPLAVVEPFMHGKFKKHNNNMGGIFSGRNTPQAFSHFTWEASKHRKIVCDMQGVDDYYTDPQIHTIDQRKYGLGNMGLRGIQTFLSTHTCNPVCQLVGLPQLDRGVLVAPALRDASKPPRPMLPQSSSTSASSSASSSTASTTSGRPPSREWAAQQQQQQQQPGYKDPNQAQDMWLSRAETPQHTAAASLGQKAMQQQYPPDYNNSQNYYNWQQQQQQQPQQQQSAQQYSYPQSTPLAQQFGVWVEDPRLEDVLEEDKQSSSQQPVNSFSQPYVWHQPPPQPSVNSNNTPDYNFNTNTTPSSKTTNSTYSSANPAAPSSASQPQVFRWQPKVTRQLQLSQQTQPKQPQNTDCSIVDIPDDENDANGTRPWVSETNSNTKVSAVLNKFQKQTASSTTASPQATRREKTPAGPVVAVASGAVGERLPCPHAGCEKSFFTSARLQAHITEAHGSDQQTQSGNTPSYNNQVANPDMVSGLMGSVKSGFEALACNVFR